MHADNAHRRATGQHRGQVGELRIEVASHVNHDHVEIACGVELGEGIRGGGDAHGPFVFEQQHQSVTQQLAFDGDPDDELRCARDRMRAHSIDGTGKSPRGNAQLRATPEIVTLNP